MRVARRSRFHCILVRSRARVKMPYALPAARVAGLG